MSIADDDDNGNDDSNDCDDNFVAADVDSIFTLPEDGLCPCNQGLALYSSLTGGHYHLTRYLNVDPLHSPDVSGFCKRPEMSQTITVGKSVPWMGQIALIAQVL